MHSVRSAKIYYFAAFVLGALIALLVAAPARALPFAVRAPLPPSDHAHAPDANHWATADATDIGTKQHSALR